MASRWQENYQLYRRYVRNIALLYQKRKDIQTYVELLLSLSVIAIFGLFAIRPTVVTITSLFTEIETKEETIAKLDSKIDALTRAQTLFDQNRIQLALVDSVVPDEPLPDIFTRQFEGLTQLNSTELLSVNVGEVDILGTANIVAQQQINDEDIEVDLYPEELDSVEFGADVGGTFDTLTTLIREVENMRRPLFGDSVTLRIADDDELSSDQLIFSITGRAPFLRSGN